VTRVAIALDPKVKNVLKGAAIQVAAKSASHLGFIIARNQGVPDATLRANPWYAIPFPGLNIPTDDFVTCLGIPAGLFVASRIIKTTQSRKEALKEMAIGAGLTGVAALIHQIILVQGPKAFPPMIPKLGSQMSYANYNMPNNIPQRNYQGSGSKYTIA